jgi:hypothetical protein
VSLICIAMSIWHIIACYIYQNVRFLSYIIITYPFFCGRPVNIQWEDVVLLTISISNISIITSITVVLFCVELSYHITIILWFFFYEWNIYLLHLPADRAPLSNAWERTRSKATLHFDSRVQTAVSGITAYKGKNPG